jgi:fucose 4-O-acetylase-like acetyltransferase
MSFIQNFTAGAKIVFARLQTRIFWQNFAKVAIPFFIVVTLISLLINSWREIFSGDFAAVSEANFNDGKWENFFGFKLFFSAFYALYITNKKMK